VRSAQAEERVRHAANAAVPLVIRDMTPADLATVVGIEREVFSDPWPERFFLDLLARGATWARIAERDGALAGYALTAVVGEEADLENIATVPGQRRAGVARVLLEDALREAARRGASRMALDVRASNDAAQTLYRTHGFRLAGLRRGYYQHPDEDALVMARPLGGGSV
jgi:ribosomal-protein-alanine N-acetyltransferase